MTADEFALVRELFHKGCDLPVRERTEFLRSSCHGRPEVLAAVEALFQTDQTNSSGFDLTSDGLAHRLLSPVESDPGPPESVGPYRILRVLGEGGMGVAYLAEQAHPQRQVALKILRGGPASGSLRARFAREIQVLGRLEHPSIARIYDAGTAETPRGPLAYFAMEFIDGPRITRFAQEQALDRAALVALMARIADAVQHAHSRGVIHRDLKPANILIRTAPAPTPVILDFGVARLLDDSAGTLLTETGAIVGTLEYMSPEQLAGDANAVDARTDIYSMGVMLYELVAGRQPYQLRGKPIAEAARIVRDEEPANLRAHRPRIDRDLQTIIAKAMAKDPARRYATAAALADDLRRYAAGEAILARPATLAYQFSRFAGRRKALVAASAAALLALVAGLVVSSRLYIREQEAHARADDNQRLSDSVREYLIDGLLMAASPDRMGYDVKVLDVLSKAADGLHDRFLDHPEIEAGVRADLADALGKIGKLDESAAQWELAIPQLEATLGPDDRKVIHALIRRSEVLQQAQKHGAARQPAEEALTRARRALDADDPLLVLALNQCGAWHVSEGNIKRAEKLLREGLDLARRHPEANRNAIVPLMTYLSECQRKSRDPAASLQTRRQIVAYAHETFGESSPQSIVARENLVAALLVESQNDEAAATARGLPEAAQAVFAPGHTRRAYVDRDCGQAFLAVGAHAQAEPLLLRAKNGFAAVMGEINVENEATLELLRSLYAGWPGHAQHYEKAAAEALRIALARTPRNRFFVVRNLLRAMETEGPAAGLERSAAQWTELAWQRRDQDAPEGNPLRATYLTNLARFWRSTDNNEHFAEALTLAEAALPYSARAAVVRATLRALRDRTEE